MPALADFLEATSAVCLSESRSPVSNDVIAVHAPASG